jgi:flagella basal body P-ring formation protein FlgA
MRVPAFALALLLVAAPAVAQEITAARTLRPGALVSREDLRVPPGAGERAEELVGLEVRRAIFADRPVRAGSLGPETLVRRNAVVTMVYRAGGLSIRTEGRALDPGGTGERIRVMNLESRHSVRAVVRGRNLVEVVR